MVSIFTSASPSACHSASAFQILSKSAFRDIVMSSYLFSKMADTAPEFYFRFRFFVNSLNWEGLNLRQTKFWRDISIHTWDITTSGFWKQTTAMLEFYFRFRFSRLRHHRHATLHLPTKLRPNRNIHDIVMTSYLFSKMAATASQFYFLFHLLVLRSVGRSKSTGRPNFGEISQSTADILLLPVSENKRPPCWNSTSSFDFHVCITTGMSFCICLPNFV